MAWVDISDLTGTAEVLIFPRSWQKFQVAEGDIVILEGNKKAGESKFFAASAMHLSSRQTQSVSSSSLPSILLRLDMPSVNDLTQDQINEMKSVFDETSGGPSCRSTWTRRHPVLISWRQVHT